MAMWSKLLTDDYTAGKSGKERNMGGIHCN